MSGKFNTHAEEIASIQMTYEKRIDVMQASYDLSEKLRHDQEVRMIGMELIARHALQELEDQGTLDFLLIKDPKARTWWEENK